eukprot:jgi/Galph1/4721/GphlegSOOS_G3386.1
MQHDDVIWSVVGKTFCSFRTKTNTGAFCRNPYNVTGICSRGLCPLANSRYATIIEVNGECFLYMKTVERAHEPRSLWEKIKLSKSYQRGLEQIDQKLQFWPRYLIHKAKQRFTKIRQYLIRKKRLQLKLRGKLTVVNKKVERRERSREKKAEGVAKLEKKVEEELLARLRSGTYDDIYNFPTPQYESVLEREQVSEPETVEFEEDYESDEVSDEEDVEYAYSEVEELENEQPLATDIEEIGLDSSNSKFDDSVSIDEEIQTGVKPEDVLMKRWSKKAQVKRKAKPTKGRGRVRKDRRQQLEFEVERELDKQVTS